MSKKAKTSFRYNRLNSVYTIQLKKRRNLWWLLLLLLFPLYIILFFDYTVEHHTGYNPDNEPIDIIPDDIIPPDDVVHGCDLEQMFPPIGNQGQFGTCTTWAVGYNLKTALNAIDKGWTTEDLAKPENQTSPKDLWLAIPSNAKGQDCDGTYFEAAFSVLMEKGCAPLKDVPYDMTSGACEMTNSKGDIYNKIANFRKIAYTTNVDTVGFNVDNFKRYLNNCRPVVIGAFLGDRFHAWQSSEALSYDTYKISTKHSGGHAMVLVGYNDEKHAFRVRNSWGENRGDKGSIWIDYDFFFKSFLQIAFVAGNTENEIDPYDGNDSIQSSTAMLSSSVSVGKTDLMAFWSEYKDAGDHQELYFEVYNSGETTIEAQQEWTVTGLLYQAMNANKHYILFEENIAKRLKKGEAIKRSVSCNIPENLTGKYYMALFVDTYDKIAEVNEKNNYFFISSDGKALEFENGKIINTCSPDIRQKPAKPAKYGKTDYQTLVKSGNMNTYTPRELKTMLQNRKQRTENN
jgi:hypothetical protein